MLPEPTPDLPALLVRFIGDLADRLPDARIEVTGTVTVCPVNKNGPKGGGVPINADGSPLTPTSLAPDTVGVTWLRTAGSDLFVFVATPAGGPPPAIQMLLLASMVMAFNTANSLPASSGPWPGLQLAPFNLTVYRLQPGGKVGWSALPPTSAVWSRAAYAGE